jgi:glycosyltransferase involved in cell wall biosynthesis
LIAPRVSRIVMLAPVLHETVRRERGLLALNPSGTARALYVARALRAAGRRAIVLAPGSTWRMRWQGRLWHPPRVVRQRGVAVIYAPVVGLPILGSLAELALLPLALVRLKHRYRRALVGALVYCFYNAIGVAGFMAWLLRLPIVLEVEDLGRPRLADLFGRTGYSFAQESLTWLCLNLLAPFARGAVTPAARFAARMPRRLPRLVIGGTLVEPAAQGVAGARGGGAVTALFGGSLGAGQGLDLFLDALDELDRRGHRGLRAVVTGKGGDAGAIAARLSALRHVTGRFEGFLPEAAFVAALRDADVCLALQDPRGRHAECRTPSKAFAAFQAGKAVVITDVGDLFTLPDDTCLKLAAYTPAALAGLLAGLTPERCGALGARARSWAAANWIPERDGRRLAAWFEEARPAA